MPSSSGAQTNAIKTGSFPAAELAERYKEAPRYIAVEGPIGVGKTTLSTRLAETFDYPLLLEPATENPFLDRFYRDPQANALPTPVSYTHLTLPTTPYV